MKSKSLLGVVQLAVMVAIGMTQVNQALPVLASLAQRTAAPLEQMVLLGINPSYPRSPVPAVQPSAMKPAKVCDRAAVAQVRPTVLHVEATRPMVETIDSPVLHRVTMRPVFAGHGPDAHAFALLMNGTTRADVQREMARAQREIQRALREQQVVF